MKRHRKIILLMTLATTCLRVDAAFPATITEVAAGNDSPAIATDEITQARAVGLPNVPTGGKPPSAGVEIIPNRTLPKVDPPQIGLHFTSGTPSSAEISRARVFEEPLIPIGGVPTSSENAALAAALLRYSQRTSPDDFAGLTDFLAQHPDSPWCAALLTNLGLDYYNTAHYSLALDAWRRAWTYANTAKDATTYAIVSRAGSELAYLYARLGRMTELEALLTSVGGFGGVAVKINGAREALWTMKNRPEISFRCGPLALQSIMQSLPLEAPGHMAIFNSASSHEGFSLPQVAELSKQVGLNYQMAFRGKHGAFVVPSVVHWKVGHYAAIIRRVGDRYLVQDSTFGNTVWPTREALEAETSGYFLIPSGELPPGWRSVGNAEGSQVWGKGVTSDSDPDRITDDDMATDMCGSSDQGMPVSSVHLMAASLQIRDTPVGYAPPVGPAVPFRVRYNQRDPQTAYGFSGGPAGLGVKWTSDWFSWITDNPFSPMADVKCQVGGGGANTYTGFNPTTQTFAVQQLNQTLLRRTGPDSYEQIAPDGSKRIFAQPNGAIGTSRNVYLTQVVDPAGNAVTLTYDTNLLLVAITDAIGQVTTLTYGIPAITNGGVNLPANQFLVSKVTDPFGRYATLDYGPVKVGDNVSYSPLPPYLPEFSPIYSWVITSITDVIGLTSHFKYAVGDITHIGTNVAGQAVLILYNDVITSMVTPYGTNTFLMGGGGTNGNGRLVERHYPDGSRDRVVYSQNTNGIAFSDPPALVPQGMNVFNMWLHGRNTFYWSRNASAQAYGDYSKAKIYHWLHMPNIAATSGMIESVKSPLENRVWFSYAGQTAPYSTTGSSDLPTRMGRVLDDGSTQLYSYAYNGFGYVTNSIDPVGRELSYVYATNGIDLLEVRQTRGANNEVLARFTYNDQHCALTMTDAAGQTTTNTYNARGQLLATTNPKGETTTYTYDTDGYLTAVDGPLPGVSDVVTTTYDSFGRTRTITDESGYTLTYDYDAMDRLTRVTHPDATFNQYTYNRLDLVSLVDSAGRQTVFEYDNMRQLTKQTDALGRVTRFEWCSCGSPESFTDPMGRKTEWHTDVQGRPVSKRYADGSTTRYHYENTTSRLLQVIDEKQQVTQYGYNRDNTLKSVSYINATVATPGTSFAYDPNYERVLSMTDGHGTTRYSYNPITATPTLGAGELASEDGPLADDIITFGYDELGRLVHRAINGVDLAVSIDAAGRRVSRTNVLGVFTYAFDGASDRVVSRSLPSSLIETRAYGNTIQDQLLQRITYTTGATPVSEFLYSHDVPKGRVATWSQQIGAQSPNQFSFGYDAVDQLLSAVVTNSGALVNTFAFAYDPVGNRLTEQVGSSNYHAAHNALNQITTGSAHGIGRTNEWDVLDRLVAVNAGNQRTEFTYDGLSRMVGIRQLVNGSEVSRRLFVWCGLTLCEERDAAGVVRKRFFAQGMKVEHGVNAGNYFYTRDHLSSIREIIDASGNVRARYAYDPYGRRTKLSGDLDADFGFAGMFWCD